MRVEGLGVLALALALVHVRVMLMLYASDLGMRVLCMLYIR